VARARGEDALTGGLEEAVQLEALELGGEFASLCRFKDLECVLCGL